MTVTCHSSSSCGVNTRLSVIALLCSSIAGCSHRPELYCTASEPCSAGLPYCDVRGECEASGYITNTCIPEPCDVNADTDGGASTDASLVDASTEADAAPTCGNPVELGFYSAPERIYGLRASGQYVYISRAANGFIVLDTSTGQPVKVGEWLAASDSIYDLEIVNSGSGIFVSDDRPRLVEISNLSTIVTTATGNPKPPAWGFAYDAPTLYAVDGFGLKIYSVSGSIVERGTLDTPGTAYDIVKSGRYAYIADEDAGLRIVDTINPDAPAEVGFLEFSGAVEGVFVKEDLAFLAATELGLRVVDVSDRTAPVQIGVLDTPGRARRVFVAGDKAYVADEGGGLRVIDVSDPTQPVEVADFPTTHYAFDVVVVDDIAYVADTQWTSDTHFLRMIDVCP